jgi:hypothetical protein
VSYSPSVREENGYRKVCARRLSQGVVGAIDYLVSAVVAQRGYTGDGTAGGLHDPAMHGANDTSMHVNSPYAGQFSGADQIRVLTPDEIDQIRAGEGAGLAKAAELNGVPGPRHVLDLAADLGLSPEQMAKIQPIYDEMRVKAAAAGSMYLAAQQALETDFRNGRLTAQALPARLTEVARLRAELEGTRLSAHLATAAILRADQVAHNILRGY